jgi:metallo-beta-lactamase family protein
MQIKFLGAARTVTGSKHLITTASGKNILLDCGLFQGKGAETDDLNRHFGFSPLDIDYLILSHAHTDHSGNIPYLVKQGFQGKIYSTQQTLELCQIMLMDSGKIQESDVAYINKKRARKGQTPLNPLYTVKDVEKCFELFNAVSFDERFEIEPGIHFTFTPNGHILGSATSLIEIEEEGRIYKIAFTGDIGRPHEKILRPPQPFAQADYIIAESTYGDRLHESSTNAEKKLHETVVHTCVDKRGKVIIPAFSLGRTQEIVYSLDKLYNQGILPKIPVFVDSPLSSKTTDIIRHHPECFNLDTIEYMMKDEDPFSFKNLNYVTDVKESMALNDTHEPCIIISSSGMAEAGRIKHHLKNNIQDSKNTVLFTGYCTPDSLGGQILAGNKRVRIFGTEYDVNAEVQSIPEYSAHGDFVEMVDFLSCQNKEKVKQIFLVHGEYETQKTYKGILHVAGFKDIEIPEPGSVYVL